MLVVETKAALTFIFKVAVFPIDKVLVEVVLNVTGAFTDNRLVTALWEAGVLSVMARTAITVTFGIDVPDGQTRSDWPMV